MPGSVLIVVPTLGRRIDFLDQTLRSISGQKVSADILVVVPASAGEARELAQSHGARLMDDPGSLAGAINVGIASADPSVEFVNWIGDDDLLTQDSLALTTSALIGHVDRVLAYGSCKYIDDQGRLLWTSRAGKWASRVLSWGPDLIPQPGMLVRRTAWDRVGGVDESLKFAFDLDLLLKLKAVGGFIDVGAPVSAFRWHPQSLTVSDRTQSLDESEAVKRRYLSPAARRMSWTWEKPVRVATRAAAWEVSRRAEKHIGSPHTTPVPWH